MAYIKIFPIKVTDKKALDYITNPDKTDEKVPGSLSGDRALLMSCDHSSPSSVGV